ncbi:MAG: A24 family peptidase [Planctomycetota bacterium]
MTDPLTLTTAICLGAILGSFLNVVIHRLPERDVQRSQGTRSACPACGAPIPIWCNIPVLAWLFLRGKARCCGAKISIRYPIVELLTASLVVVAVFEPPFSAVPLDLLEPSWRGVFGFVLFAYFTGNLIANTFIDLEFRRLPDRLTIPLTLVGLCSAPLLPEMHQQIDALADSQPWVRALLESLAGFVVGRGLTWLIHAAAPILFGKPGMGLGDVKLMGGLGAFLGWQGALLTFFVASLLGAVGGSLRLLFTRDPYVAFGPVLVLAAFLTAFFRQDMLDFWFETLPTWSRESESAPIVLIGALVVCSLMLLVLRRRRRGGSEVS